MICILHGDAEGTGIARDRIICKLGCDALFEYGDTGQNGQWMVSVGWRAAAIEAVTGFLEVHMQKKISENEGMRRSHQRHDRNARTREFRRAVGALISRFDIND